MKTHTQLKLLDACKDLERDSRVTNENSTMLINRCNYCLERAVILENQEEYKEHRNSLLLMVAATVIFLYERMNSEEESDHD